MSTKQAPLIPVPPPSLPPHLPDDDEEEEEEKRLPTFSDYLLKDLFSSPLPRIPRKARPPVILSIKMVSHLFLLGWRKNDELEDQLNKIREEMFQSQMKKVEINQFLNRLSSRLSDAMRSYVDKFGYTRMNELVKINQAEYKALSSENSAYAERILGQRFVSMRFGSTGTGPSLNLGELERIKLPTECRRKGRSLWARAFRILRERRMLKESKVIRTFSMLIASHKLLTRVENKRQGEKFVVFLGGGMAAGKSTIINKLYEKSAGAVMIAADDFKFKDPVWDSLPKATSSMKLAVHRSSTKTAEQLLLSCLANGRSVILDGTLSWLPFVKQTIAMIRDYKNHAFYRVGPGYKVVVNPDTGLKTVTEKYWELDSLHKRRSREYEPECRIDNEFCSKGPYRVDIVGVVCDPAEAVVRGFRRTLATSRGVPVKSQLRSHRLFATHVSSGGFLPLVDRMAVYNTTNTRDPKPCVVYDKSRNGKLYQSRRKSIDNGSTVLMDTEQKFPGFMIFDKTSWKMIQKTVTLKDNANSAHDLYSH